MEQPLKAKKYPRNTRQQIFHVEPFMEQYPTNCIVGYFNTSSYLVYYSPKLS